MLFEVWLMSMKTPDISREHSYIYHTVLFCIGTLMNVQHLCQHIYPHRFCTVLLSETHDNLNHTPILTMQTWQHTLSSFHHDVPLAINQVAAESVCDNWIGTCGKTTKIHSSHHILIHTQITPKNPEVSPASPKFHLDLSGDEAR